MEHKTLLKQKVVDINNELEEMEVKEKELEEQFIKAMEEQTIKKLEKELKSGLI